MENGKAILDAILSLREATEMGFARVDARFVRVETRLEGLETRLGALETRLGNFEVKVYERFDRLDSRLSSVEQR